jgi:type VI secretion system secreted protein VgrG
MQDVITVSCAAVPDSTRVVGFQGDEGISTPYSFFIDILVGHATDSALDEATGEKISLTFDHGDGRPPLRVHGIVASVRLVHDAGSGGVWRVQLAPRLADLALNLRSKIFVGDSTPEIIEKVLKEAGLDANDFELRLADSYPKRDHVCQCEESDLSFIARWMERDGLYYFFEQLDDHEKLIITDSAAFHQDFASNGIRYVPGFGADGGFTRVEAFDTFACDSARVPSKVRLDDYDYLRPDLELTGKAPVAPRGFGEVRLHGENFATVDEGKRLANVRAQEILAAKKLFRATGNTPYVRSGYTLSVEEHPRESFNAKYIATRVRHAANQAAHALKLNDLLGYDSDELYRVEVTASPASVQYRAPRVTVTPRIYGTVGAIVDGPADSEYAQIDKHGRYKVRVMFDESDAADGKASMFVRMLQPHGGSPEGFHFPLRKGTEVHLLFLGGDPDRPVIAAVAPNAQTPSVVTADNHTKNVIHTGGNNRVELEDSAGKQHVKLSTPTKNSFFRLGGAGGEVDSLKVYDTAWSSDGSAITTTGENYDITVGGHSEIEITNYKKEHVVGAVRETYDDKFTQIVTADVHEHYKAEQRTNVDGPKKTMVGGNVVESYGASHATMVEGEQSLEVMSDRTVVVMGTQESTVIGNHEAKVMGEYKLTAQGDINLTSAGQIEQHMCSSLIYNEANEKKLTVGTSTETFIGVKDENVLGGLMEITALDHIEVDLGGRQDMFFGVAFEVAMALWVEACSGIRLRILGTEVKEGTLNLDTGVIHIEKNDLKVED